MNIDELIRESIDEAAGDRSPAPDLDRIHHRGRRRTIGRVGGATLATLAVIAGGTYAVQSLGGPHESETLPASIRHQGPAVAFVTYDPTTAHFDGKELRPEHKSSLEASAMTRAGLIYVSGDSNGTPYLLENSGEETRLGRPTNADDKKTWAAQVIASTDRNTAVWSTDVTGPRVRLNLFDASSRTVSESITFDPADVADGPDVSWSGLDTMYAGVVYGTVDVSGELQSFAWDPSRPEGEQVYAATDPGTVVSAVGADRLVLEGKGDAYGGPDHEPVDPAIQVTRLPGGENKGVGAQSATLSPDGRWALVDPDKVNDFGFSTSPDEATFNDPSLDYAVMNLDTGEILPFHSQGIVEAKFDDDGSVLIVEVTPDGGDRLIDCTLPSEECTTVLDNVPGSFID